MSGLHCPVCLTASNLKVVRLLQFLSVFICPNCLSNWLESELIQAFAKALGKHTKERMDSLMKEGT